MLRPLPARLGIRLRRICYRPFFAGLGHSVRIAEGVQIRAPWGITLKDDVAVNFGASLDGQGGLTCEERALIGPYAVLHTTEHLRPKPGDNYRYRFEPVTVGAWAVVTAHVVVTAGTTIGSAALVGAGAVVTHDVAGGEVVAGVPARTIIRSSDEPSSSQDQADVVQS
jgi:acetyltransferase-like isoleucine patch superfamily enzyme